MYIETDLDAMQLLIYTVNTIQKGVKRTQTEQKLNIKEIKDKTPKSIVLKLIPKNKNV